MYVYKVMISSLLLQTEKVIVIKNNDNDTSVHLGLHAVSSGKHMQKTMRILRKLVSLSKHSIVFTKS